MKVVGNECIAIYVPNLTEAKGFFITLLGQKIVEDKADYFSFQTATNTFYVKAAASYTPPIPSFNVENIEAVASELITHGCEVVKDGESKYLRTNFGFLFDIIETPQSESSPPK